MRLRNSVQLVSRILRRVRRMEDWERGESIPLVPSPPYVARRSKYVLACETTVHCSALSNDNSITHTLTSLRHVCLGVRLFGLNLGQCACT